MSEHQEHLRPAPRRTALVAAGVVGVLAVVGGVAFLSSSARERTAPPVAASPSASVSSPGHADPLPNPAALDAAALTAATGAALHPWRAAPWPDGPTAAAMAPCLGRTSESTDDRPRPDQPARLGSAAFRSDDGGRAVVGLSSYRSSAALSDSWSQAVSQVGGCAGARTFATRWPDGTGLAYRLLPVGAAPQDLWLARVGNAFGIVWLQHPGTAPDERTDARVLAAVAAALRDPTSYPSNPMDHTLGPDAGHAFGTIDPRVLTVALGSWHSGWRGPGNPTSNALARLPCEPRDQNTVGGTGEGAGVGVDGTTWLWDLHSEREARTGLATLTRLLRGCAGYQVSTARTALGPVVVAFAPGRQVVWMERVRSSVGYLILPAAARPPPEETSINVGGVLHFALAGT